MSILRAITRAYDVALERDWDTVYWALDLHGTVLRSNYSNHEFEFINDQVVEALQYISNLCETRIIVWSSINPRDWGSVRSLFVKNGIRVHYCNENPEVKNTGTGDFSRKFYMSVIVDDKAGFDPEEWAAVAQHVREQRARLPFSIDPSLRYDLPTCPRCDSHAKSNVIHGIHTLRCSLVKCGALITGKTAEEVEAKWTLRAPITTAGNCPHCGSGCEPFSLNLSGQYESHGFQCRGCGMATGGRTPEIALQIHQRIFNGV